MKGRKFLEKAFVTILSRGSVSAQTCVGLSRDQLLYLRGRAVRHGAWFKALSKAERAYLELVIKVVERVRSRLVAKVLACFMRKLLSAMRSRVACQIKKIGHTLARKLGRIAQNWGNPSADRWARDHGFIQYLAVTYMNMPGFYGSQ